MLEKIREGSQGLAAKIILGLVILSFALAGIGGYLGQTTEQPVAEVNGVQISQTEFSRAFENERARLEQQFGEYFAQIAADPNYMAQIRNGVIDRLVQQELQNQLALQLGLRVSDEQVKQAIVEMPYFQVAGQFNNDAYLRAIRQMNFQPDTFREFLREEMTRTQLVSAVAGSDFVLPGELQQTAALQQQTRNIDYVVLTKEKMKSQVSVSDEEVNDYYQLNQQQFMAPEQVAVQYLELKADDIALDTPVTDEDVRAYYEESKSQYLEEEKRRVAHILIDNSEDDAAAEEKASAILAELKAGADFATLAEEKSDDIVSAELGGDLDWIERDVMEPAFEDAAFALTNIGDFTDVVATEFGYHIIKLTDLQAQVEKPFEEVAAELRAELEKNAKLDLFYQKQTEVAELAFEVADTLEDASLAAGVELKTTELVSRMMLPAPLNSPAVSTTIFTPELLEDKVNSEVLEVAPEHFVVVRVTEHVAAATKLLEAVKEQIVSTLTNEKASSLLAEYSENLFTEFKAGKALQEIATAETTEVSTEAALQRQSYSVAPAIVKEVFALPHPSENGKVESLVTLNNGDVALVQLNSVTTPEITAELDAQQKQGITMSAINKNYLAFVSALESKAEVVRPTVQVTEEN
ncbi:peptidylprolyl isomerase [Pseudoalteromonas phenolica]|uniref:Periplasmic chaperone PpiD n=1 Tax=Pseudoalteromonas phenolica TaxID=161398 RepID=A0A5R9PYU9_9GAMM|nr:SurA N-terminal domain-containing protein [Pseudoalteromonas phenolica]TLX45506.1 peptidylprolyl isomerase [Pseudoalteromonas phenolica]